MHKGDLQVKWVGNRTWTIFATGVGGTWDWVIHGEIYTPNGSQFIIKPPQNQARVIWVGVRNLWEE